MYLTDTDVDAFLKNDVMSFYLLIISGISYFTKFQLVGFKCFMLPISRYRGILS